MNQGLHERQYRDLYHEDDVPLSNLRPGALRILVYTCSATVLLLILCFIFLHIPREVRVPFSLRTDAREVQYRFAENTQVLKMFVKPGQIVREGDTLARISSASIVSLINQLRAAREARDLFERADVPMNKNEKESLTLERSKYQSQINDAKKERSLRQRKQSSELDNLQQEVNAATKHAAEMKKLQSQGFASEKELRDAQLKESNAKDAYNRAKQQSSMELNSVEERIRQLELDQSLVGVHSNRSDLELDKRRAQLTADVNSLESKIRELYGRVDLDSGSIVLRSSVNLNVSYSFSEEHELPAGTVLLKLSATATKLYAQCSVPPQLIGSMKEGMEAAMKVSSFPSYHWGMLKGRITHKSMSPDEKGSYPVEIEISESGQLGNLLQIGMSGDADVLVESRPLGSYVFEHLSAPFRR